MAEDGPVEAFSMAVVSEGVRCSELVVNAMGSAPISHEL